jgi:hypothetical protein
MVSTRVLSILSITILADDPHPLYSVSKCTEPLACTYLTLNPGLLNLWKAEATSMSRRGFGILVTIQ